MKKLDSVKSAVYYSPQLGFLVSSENAVLRGKRVSIPLTANEIELRTVITDVEAVIKDLPLTHASADRADREPIRLPIFFLGEGSSHFRLKVPLNGMTKMILPFHREQQT